LVFLMAAGVTLPPSSSHACEGVVSSLLSQPEKPAAGAVKQISIDALAALLQQRTDVSVLDANPDSVRSSLGTVPGAVLLTSASRYQLTELPAEKDRTLVFYCFNEQCTASHAAAKRASAAGYSHVLVLSAGIQGWKAAGRPTRRTS